MWIENPNIKLVYQISVKISHSATVHQNARDIHHNFIESTLVAGGHIYEALIHQLMDIICNTVLNKFSFGIWNHKSE